MRPIKLTMKAFGPYAKETLIDFSQFHDGLYLVAGDTGSGKTSIFDALTYALYGEVSGSIRDASMMRSDYASPSDETFVELLFSHKNKEYTIRRNPRYQREKLSGTGLTEQIARSSLILPNGIEIDNLQEVNQTIIDLLGIDAKQFKQIVMIAQGEFLKLLNASSSERSQIFRTIFDTRLYEKIQDKLADDERQLKNQLKVEEQKVVEIKEKVSKDEDVLITEVEDYLKKSITENTVQIQELTEGIEALTKQKEILIKTISSAEQHNKDLESYHDQIKRQMNHLQEKDNILRLSKLRDQVQISLQSINPIYLELKKTSMDLKREESKLLESKQKLKELDKLQLDLKAKEADMLQLRETFDQRKIDLNRLIETLKDYEVLGQHQKELTVLKEKTVKEEVTLMHAKEQKVVLNQALEKAKKQSESIHGAELEISKLNQSLEESKRQQAELNKAKTVLKKLEENKKNKDSLSQNYSELQKNIDIKQTEYLHVETTFYHSQAGLLAKQLINDKPCPVCGSLDHPSPSSLSETLVDKETLDQLKDALNILLENRNKLSETLAALNNQIQQEEIELQSLAAYGKTAQEQVESTHRIHSTVESLNQKLNVLQQKVKEAKKQRDYVKQIEIKLKAIETTIESSQIHTMKNDVNLKEQLLKTIQKGLRYPTMNEAQKQVKINQASLSHDEKKVDVYQKDLQRLEKERHQTNHSITEYEKQCKLNKTVLSNQTKQFEEALAKYNIQDKKEFERLIKQESMLDEYTRKINKYATDTERFNEIIVHLEQRLSSKEEKDIKAYRIEQEQINQKIKSKTDHNDALKYALKNHETLLQDYQEVSVRFKQLNQRYQNVSLLSKTSRGQLEGKDKISLEQYVQSAYFEFIIQEANKRFKKMTNDQFELYRQEEASNRRTQSGLDLEVLDRYTGKKRSVKSLSGGESFKASLALALGLSDVTQSTIGGVVLDAMFVDEGFGTLDEKSLDQAIRTLMDLASEQRIIGIISHVPELKQIIPQQIHVRKASGGSVVDMENI
ncbi:AAA family ATPase [Erysipelothrix urinaevulpis]|uniref:AAA family ATPase n=1 Tax=Erysipelothrix urinaevulpis TaxID=2683717 RepID=UPI001357DE73|nr:SMC family ATPase [Erysipelothrix urinaevulpis]